MVVDPDEMQCKLETIQECIRNYQKAAWETAAHPKRSNARDEKDDSAETATAKYLRRIMG